MRITVLPDMVFHIQCSDKVLTVLAMDITMILDIRFDEWVTFIVTSYRCTH